MTLPTGGIIMAHKQDQKLKGDRVSSRQTKSQDERHMRVDADHAGQERGAMGDAPDQESLPPAQDNTADPRPFDSKQRRSGPARPERK
jgi:hypothetical protein